MRTFRAAYWLSDDGQAELLLTGPDHADLPAEKLVDEARAEISRQGGTEDGGRIVVGMWTEVGMAASKIATVHVADDVTARGNVLYAGTYRVEMPADYEPSEVTGEDILCDGALRIVDG
jgi:hypothetical protein